MGTPSHGSVGKAGMEDTQPCHMGPHLRSDALPRERVLLREVTALSSGAYGQTVTRPRYPGPALG